VPSLFIEPCLPTISRTVPTGPQWAFEILRSSSEKPGRAAMMPPPGLGSFA
jgi:hypothetical protein